MKPYQTEQRRRLLEFFESNRDKQYSIDEISLALSENSVISKSAVYRNVDKMVKEGLIQRLAGAGSRKFLYQYTAGAACAGYFHMQCVKCGCISHLDEATAEIMKAAISQSHEFILDGRKTILYGVCRKCK